MLTGLATEEKQSQQQFFPRRQVDDAVAVPTPQVVAFDQLNGSVLKAFIYCIAWLIAHVVPSCHCRLLFDAGTDLHIIMVIQLLKYCGIGLLSAASTNSHATLTRLNSIESPASLYHVHSELPSLQPFITTHRDWQLQCVTPVLNTVVASQALLSSPGKLSFVRNMLRSLYAVGVIQRSTTLQCMYIECEALCARVFNDVDAVRTAIRTMLSAPENSNKLQLWLSYGVMESVVGNSAESRRVVDKAAALSASLPQLQSRHKYNLWLALAQHAIASDQTMECLHVLASAVDTAQPYVTYARAVKKVDSPDKLVPATRILKARTAFTNVRSSLV